MAAMRTFLCLLAAVGVVALSGCCPPAHPPLGPPPPPQSAAAVISALNAHAQQVSALKAKGSVTLVWVDSDGRHTQTADGILMLRKHTAPEPAAGMPAADVVLIGRVAGQNVFELGVNAHEQWLAFRVDPKRAYVGPVGPNSPLPPGVPFRADRLLQVLALAQLGQQPDTRLAMTIRDDPAVNTVLVVRTPRAGFAQVERELVIDRRTRQVSAVRFYQPDGLIEAVAELGDYRPAVRDDDDGNLTPIALQMPHRVVVEHRATQARVELHLDYVQLMPELLGATFDRTFAKPDFAAEGIPEQPISNP
jgi:hypothetical protein